MDPTLPHISVVVRLDANRPRYVKATLESLLAQSYHAFTVYVFYEEHMSIDTVSNYENITFVPYKGDTFWKTVNSYLGNFRGEQLLFVESEDVLSPEYLFAVSSFDDKAVVYANEARIGDWGGISFINDRPDFDWLLLQHLDYFARGVVYNLEILRELGGFRWATESPTHDYALRLLEKYGEDGFHHIPSQYYYSRRRFKEVFTDCRNEAHMCQFDPVAITGHLNRLGMKSAYVWNNNGTPKTDWREPRKDQIEVVIFGTQAQTLIRLYYSLLDGPSSHNLQVTLLAPRSELQELGDVLGGKAAVRLTVASNLAGALTALQERSQKTTAEFLCFLDRPASLDQGSWLEQLWDIAQRPGVGLVSPRVTSSTDTLEYLGVQADNFDPLSALYYHKDARTRGRFNRGMVAHQVTWPSPSCVMFRVRNVQDGFDLQFKDLVFHDLALFIRSNGLAITVAPQSTVRTEYSPDYDNYADELPLLYAKHGSQPKDWPEVPSFPWP